MGDKPIAERNPFIVQQIPEMRTNILKDKNREEIAKYQLKAFFSPTAEEVQREMKSLAELYTSDVFDDFLGDPKCANCGDVASQRCSKCKSEWYCSRECQLARWKDHKAACKIASEARAKLEEFEKANPKPQREAPTKKEKKPLIQEIN